MRSRMHLLRESEWRCIWSYYWWEDFFHPSTRNANFCLTLFYTVSPPSQADDISYREGELRDWKENLGVGKWCATLGLWEKLG